MTIERDASIKFHEYGTLIAVTRWISTHDEGLAEWLKNARRAYQGDRAAVSEDERAAVLLVRDADESAPARIGLLDVGGATLEDVTAWSTWQDPEASSRDHGTAEEETQGNGGKTYMFRLFKGPGRIFGVRDGKRNCKGFEGAPETVERGTPGFIPDAASGREVPITSVDAELRTALEPYGLDPDDLPRKVLEAVRSRQAFTLVEGVDPIGFLRGRIDCDDLIWRTVRHEQSTLAIEQVEVYALHNGAPVAGGEPLRLQAIPPYPELEGPFVYEVPDELPLRDGETVSTTESGARSRGRLVLMTSHDNMHLGYKNLRPRWRISYRTTHQMIGAKPVSDFAPTTPGAAFIYGTVELPALEPGYVDHGRRRPKDGPLVEAVDRFVEEKIKELAKDISERRREDLDERSLDEVQEENKRLDEFKNQFLSQDGAGEGGGDGDDGRGPDDGEGPEPRDTGTEPDSIELTVPEPALRVGLGVQLNLKRILGARVRDVLGRTVPSASLQWHSEAPHIADFSGDDRLIPRRKGRARVWATVEGEPIESERVPIDVWVVDHVLLTPRQLEIPLGKRKQITAEVTNDEGGRATDVFLEWRHDADDPMIVRIRPSGWVTANRLGSTLVSAGAPGPSGVWARIPVEVRVVPNPDEPHRGSGFPRLLLTGRDIDPATDEIREGDPDAPALWQEVTDFEHNVWWLNVQSPEAAFAFGQRDADPVRWRQFHTQKVIDMVIQVLMQDEFTRRGDDERQASWAAHKQALDRHQVQTVQQMWDAMEQYVLDGGGIH